MRDEQLEALREAAADGIDFDGLGVDADGSDGDGTYRFAVPGDSYADLDDDQLESVAREHADYVTNWYFWHAVAPQKDDRWAFLRWLEDASGAGNATVADGAGDADDMPDSDGESALRERYVALAEGVSTEWGQLRITVELDGDGQRRYDLRHTEDADTPGEELTEHDDPLEARRIAKHDDDGKYRPLKTAPTLQRGWRFPELDADGLVQAVDFLYPATIPNWHREREGELDVSHWRETMERQTGIYGVIQTWDRQDGHEHVDWVAEACCVDSQCLKRREWEYDDETELAVDGGDGQFPCREPCSLVVAAARKWTKLEGEETRTYEFELTPSEKEQIEDIVDAVADGRTDEIREADIYEGANRYRTRFLRAKLFDDEGNLGGVPTDEE
ncbi:MAG: DR2241 family protein [Haloarculaceae archaeon]